MTKTNYLRNIMYEYFDNGEYSDAVAIGESLLKEHWNNRTMWTRGYSDDLFNTALAHEKINNLQRAAELYSDSARQLNSGKNTEDLVSLVDRLTNFGFALRSQGLIFPSSFVYAQVVDACSKIKDEYPLKFADACYNLGNAFALDGQNDDALEQHKKSLEIRKELFTEESNDELRKNIVNSCHSSINLIDELCKDIVNSCHSIAFIYEDEEQFETALEYARMAIIYSDNTNNITCTHYIAELYEANDMIEDAIYYYRSTLEELENITGRNHNSYFNISSKLAALLADDEKLEEALDISLEMLDYIESSSINSLLSHTNCLRNIAVLYDRMDKPYLAEDFMMRALSLRIKANDDASYEVNFLLKKYIDEQRKEDAIGMFALAILKKIENFNIEKVISKFEDTFNDTMPEDISEYIDIWRKLEDEL